MIEQLRSWVLNIVTLATFIVLLEILVPKGKTKKYINLVSGFVLIIAMINPAVGFFKKGFDFKELSISTSNFIDKKEIENNAKILKDKQLKQIVDAYRSKIIKQLEDSTKEISGVADVKADVIFNEDYKSDSFGEIKRVILDLRMENNQTGIKEVTKIEKIQISGTDKPKESSKSIDENLKNQIESKIGKMLEVKKENIVITAQKQ